MKKSPKRTLINSGLLIGFGLLLVGVFVDIKVLNSIALLLIGLLFTLFSREVAEERFNIDKETKNEFLKKYIFASETIERSSVIVLIGGIVFLVIGVLTAISVLF